MENGGDDQTDGESPKSTHTNSNQDVPLSPGESEGSEVNNSQEFDNGGASIPADENPVENVLPSTGHVKYLIKMIENNALSSIQSNSDTPKCESNGTSSQDTIPTKTPLATSLSVPILKLESSGEKTTNGEGLSRILSWGSSFRRRKKKEKSERNSQFYTSPSDYDSDRLSTASDLSPSIYCNEIGSRASTCSIQSVADSESDSISKVIDSDVESLTNIGCTEKEPSNTPKSYLIAKELVTSEQVYIATLRLINVEFRNFVEFHNHESKSKVIPEADLKRILNHLPELQALNEDILSDMKQRLDGWQEKPKIADVIVKKGAFLKMYGQYAQDFVSKTEFLDECCAKYPEFRKVVRDFEASDRCRKLTLRHHMLKPVQRIPQYRLLLEDYLKHIDVTSVDYEDTLRAVRVVNNVADHVNNSMKFDDKVQRMVELQSMLGDFELVQPGRELIKDGPLEKVCRKSVQDRFFILLNDCLLYSTPHKNVLHLHQTLSLHGMKVKVKEDDINEYTFVVHSTKKSFVLSAKSESERKSWVDALNSAISDYNARKRSFMMHAGVSVTDGFKLGKEAPVWIPDGKVTMCQLCMEDFTKLYRRHHCRACGKVVCWKCSDNHAPLAFNNFKPQRVCDPCLNLLLKDYEENEFTIKKELPGDDEAKENAYLNIKSKFVRSSLVDLNKQKKSVPYRLTAVPANDAEVDISGWLRPWKTHKWRVERKWYVLKERVLYVYRASEDVVATHTVPVLGYAVERLKETLENVKPNLTFQLKHPAQQPLIFAADTPEFAERWFKLLSAAAVFDTL